MLRWEEDRPRTAAMKFIADARPRHFFIYHVERGLATSLPAAEASALDYNRRPVCLIGRRRGDVFDPALWNPRRDAS